MDTLRFAIIHSLDRENPRDEFGLHLREDVLDRTNEHVISLAQQLVSLVGREGSAVTYGRFRDDRREGPFPAAVERMATASDEQSFIAMSKTAMEQLKQRADDENFATGGIVCFVSYQMDAVDYLLVAMIKERDALTLTAEFVPESVSEIDLTKLHQAAKVNIPKYLGALKITGQNQVADSEAIDEEADNEDPNNTYLSFVNKNSRTEVATYFVEALGCERSLSSSKATARAVTAVTKYVASIAETRHLQSKARQDIIEYLSGQPDGAIVTIDRIARVVEHAVGPRLSEHLMHMREALNGDKFRIPEEFKLHSRALLKYTQIVGKAHNWQIKFEIGALDREDSDIVYNEEEGTLTLRNLPEDLISKIDNELRNRPAPRDDN
ncbi:nucleoid-associated protein [Xanthomonas arboricola]